MPATPEDCFLPIRYADALPAELVTTALSHLPAPDLLRCSRLERLLAQERAWSSLNSTRRDVIPIPRRLGSFDLCGGVLVGAKAPDTASDEDLLGSIGSDDDSSGDACELLGMRLPSVIADKVDVPTWSRNVGFPVYGLGIDASQDLAVIIQTRVEREDPFLIHLMTLSAFMPHSLAKQNVLEHNPGLSVSQVSVRCFGNVIGIMFHSFDHDTSQQSLIIYDWKTGASKACIDSVKEQRSFDDFGFLTSDIIILPSRKPNPASLDVYMFEKEAAPRRSSRLARGCIPPAVWIASFELPRMRTPLEVSVNTICCNSEIPPLLSSPAASSSSSSSLSPPFQLDPASALLSFSFMVCHGHSAAAAAGTPLHERFTLVVQRKAFMGRIDDLLKSTRGRWPGSSWKAWAMPWTNWGPHTSRWITMKHLSWACFVSGTRIVMSPPARDQDDDQTLCHLRILDFNPFLVAKEAEERRQAEEELCSREDSLKVEFCEDDGAIERRGAHAVGRGGKGKQKEETISSVPDETEEAKEVSVKLVDFAGCIPRSKLWLESVHSHLPYRQVTTKETFAFANVVIDEERIGGIMVNESGDLTDVHMFTM
ncbi:hypothetical protein FRB96_000365 [Tulasnella sp. 330]|nr:hypothetical protein FRB96_000365 [Tulasnella sp. 330]KAG8890922.1 hypothetical protein FRB98_002942 [Tulasnella sp. 332]